MPNPVTKRFLETVEYLKESGLIRSNRQFALAVNYLPQNLGEILKERRDAPVELLRKAIEMYDFNPVYLFTGKGGKLGSQTTDSNRMSKLTVVTDADDNAKILLVSKDMEKRYITDPENIDLIRSLPQFSLPDAFFESGDHRCFEVSSSNMAPVLMEGDLVVASFIEPFSWETFIKEGMHCVVVTRTAIHVNAVINELVLKERLVLTSENAEFTPTIIPLADISEIWTVKSIIRKNLNNNSQSTNTAGAPQINELISFINERFMDLEENMTQQSQSLQELLDKFEQDSEAF